MVTSISKRLLWIGAEGIIITPNNCFLEAHTPSEDSSYSLGLLTPSGPGTPAPTFLTPLTPLWMKTVHSLKCLSQEILSSPHKIYFSWTKIYVELFFS